jgi:hypothetical protein
VRTVKPEADVCQFSGVACFNVCLLLAPPQHLWSAVVGKLRKPSSGACAGKCWPTWMIECVEKIQGHKDTPVGPRLPETGGHALLRLLDVYSRTT